MPGLGEAWIGSSGAEGHHERAERCADDEADDEEQDFHAGTVTAGSDTRDRGY